VNDWNTYAICPGCAHIFYAPFGSIFHLHFECCPHCGQWKTDDFSVERSKRWYVQRMRYVSDAKFLSPSTWASGHWEVRTNTGIERWDNAT
jgi:hypothetical protein